jgi:hypothetical protein
MHRLKALARGTTACSPPRLPACLPRTGRASHTRWWCARPRSPAVFLLVLRTFNMHGRLFSSRNPRIRPYGARVLNPFLEMMVLPNGSMVGDWAQPRYFPQQNKGHDHGLPRGCSQEQRRARSISRRTVPAIGLVRGGRYLHRLVLPHPYRHVGSSPASDSNARGTTITERCKPCASVLGRDGICQKRVLSVLICPSHWSNLRWSSGALYESLTP